MAGFCGWLGVEPTDDSESVLRTMTGALSRIDVETRNIQSTDTCGFGMTTAPGISHSAEHRGIYAAVVGMPEMSGARHAAGTQSVQFVEEIIACYLDGGASFLERLSGHFVLALLNPGHGKALLATDRLGRSPLYCFCGESDIVFSTALGALAKHPKVPRTINPQTVFDYLYFQVIPGPGTVYRDVSSLPAATCLEWTRGDAQSTRYWSVSYTNEHGAASVAEYREEFREILRRGVRRQMQGAERVGCFLSGGTDSSTVSGVLGEVTGEQAPTYAIGFDAEGYDEMSYARIASRHFNTNHHEYYVTPGDIVKVLPELAAVYGQPFGNSSVVPAYFCAKLAGEDGVDKILGGDGGDELFAGNSRYSKQWIFSLYDQIPRSLRESVLEPVVGRFPGGDSIWPVRKARRYIEQARIGMPERLETYNFLHWFDPQQMLSDEFLGAVDRAAPLRALSQVYDGACADTMLNRMLALDLKFTLTDNDLPKVTGMTALAGVDVGYPLLDDELVEFAARLPVKLKLKGTRLRYFFKQALADFLPPEVLTKQKHGFGLPFGKWVVSDPALREFVFDSLTGFARYGVVRASFIDELKGTHLQEEAHYFGSLIWIIVVLEHWLRENTTGGSDVLFQ